MIKQAGVGLIALLTLSGCATTSADPVSLPTKTFKGKWDNVAPSTFRVLSASQVRYCFRAECTTQEYKGSADSKVRFSWGTARFVFTRTDTGYDGLFIPASGDRSTVSMR